MKRFLTLLMFAFSLLNIKTMAQGNADSCKGKSYFSFTVSANKATFSSINNAYGYMHYWSFGDGSFYNGYNNTNVSHSYVSPGSYTVTHIIKDSISRCTDSSIKVVNITSSACPSPSFYFTIDSIQPNKIYFHNTTFSGDSLLNFLWSFGDGTTSAEVNPIHIYTNPGTYNICVKVFKAGTNCSIQFCLTVIIQNLQPCNIYPNFNWTKDTINSNNLKINFYNKSLPAASPNFKFYWTFGDGKSSTEISPDHIYQSPGTYNVCLKMKRDSFCVREICKTLVLLPQPLPVCSLVANFSWTINPAVSNLVNFSNTTTPAPTSATGYQYQWSFGDGTGSNIENPSHTYTSSGTYTVCLRVKKDSLCIKEVCKPITIQYNNGVNCLEISKFRFELVPGTINSYKFIPLIQNSTHQYFWTFGDSTGEQLMTPTHTYSKPGVYRVCLSTFRNNGCASTSCIDLVTGYLSCDQTVLSFNAVKNASAANQFSFTASCNQPIISQQWTITRAGSSLPSVIINSNNPNYTFSDTGTYNVCLKVLTANGCTKQYCKQILIPSSPGNVCQIQIYPNPATVKIEFDIQLPNTGAMIVNIYNNLGTRVAQHIIAGTQGFNHLQIPIASLPTGFYTVEVIKPPNSTTGTPVCIGRFQKI